MHTRALIGEWQLSLDSRFRPWPFLSLLEKTEGLHKTEILQQGQGLSTLLNSFQEVSLQALEEAKLIENLDPWHIAFQVAAIRRFRAGWISYLSGYYFSAASILRTVLEIAMYLSAVHHGFFGFDEIANLSCDPTRTDPITIQKLQESHHRKLNQKITQVIYGSESGLQPATSRAIKRTLSILHGHVHRGESDVIHDVIEIVQSQEVPRAVPAPDLRKASIFANTAVLAAWAQSRLLKVFLRQSSTDWEIKFKLLDHSFRYYLDGWENIEAKTAFTELIEAKFTF